MRAFFNNKNSNKPLRNNYTLVDSNKTFFYAILLSPIVSILSTILFIILSAIAEKDIMSTRFGGYYSVVIMGISYLMLFFIFNKKNNIKPMADLGLKNKFNVWHFLISIIFGAACIFLLAPIVNLLFHMFGVVGSPVPYEMNSWYSVVLGILGYAILPAFAEELVFRGIIQSGAQKRFTPALAITFSAVCFTLMHGSIQQTFYQFILGFVAAMLFYFGKNILYPITFHLLNNLLVVIFELVGMPAYMTEGYFDYSTAWGIFAPILIALAFIGLFIGLYFILRLINKKSLNNIEFIVEGDNIIYEESKKLGFKNFITSQTLEEKTYFYMSFVVAIVIWISNSIS